jgi:hypothetical protein
MKITITPDQVQQLIINYLATQGINQSQVADITYSNKRSKGGVHVTVMYSEGVSTPAPVQQELVLPQNALNAVDPVAVAQELELPINYGEVIQTPSLFD